jgi:hypothetical protein
MAERASFEHPIGSPVHLLGFDIAAVDPTSTAAALHGDLQLDFWASGELAVAEVGSHVLRIVPAGDLDLPVAVHLGADVAVPLTAEILGLRFVIQRSATRA